MTLPTAPPVALAPLKVVNVGLELFSQALQAQSAPVVQVDWQPPARGDSELIGLLDELL
ncbi:MAG: hypothetical protein QM581_07490 [Pseudomonas sp.]